MRRSRVGGIIVCGLVLALVLAPPASGAKLKRITTTIKLTDWTATGSGKVFVRGSLKSPSRRCRVSRPIRLALGGPQMATSDGSGAFAVRAPYDSWQGQYSVWPFPPGGHIASVPKGKQFGRKGPRKQCKPDTAKLTIQDVAGPGLDGSPNTFDDPTNTFSGQFTLLPPCDGNRFWDMYRLAGSEFDNLTTPGDVGVAPGLGPGGAWQYTHPTEPEPGFYDALLHPRMVFPGEQTDGGNLTVVQCGGGDTVDAEFN